MAPTPPQTITLADGKEYTLAPLDLNMLVAFEEQFPEGPLQELVGSGKLKYVRYLIYLKLKEQYNLAELHVGKLLTMKALGALEELDLGV